MSASPSRIRDEITEVERQPRRLHRRVAPPADLRRHGMIPFLENDDANRALMGSNMQRQAVPLLVRRRRSSAPASSTRPRAIPASCCWPDADGTVERVSRRQIVIRTDDGEIHHYKLIKFARSNQGTCINQRPRVCEGEYVRERQVIADGPSTDEGEIALGRNVLIAFMTWEGYNYEDAVLHQPSAWSRTTSTPPSTSRSTSPRPATPSWGRRKSPATFPTSATTRCAIWTPRHHPHRRGGARGRYPRRQGHAQGRNRADRRGAPAARHLRRKGARGARHLPARAARRVRHHRRRQGI